MCYSQQHNWEQADRGIFIYTHCISLFCWHGKHRLVPVGHKTSLFRGKITENNSNFSYRLWPDRCRELRRCSASPCPAGAAPNMCCSASAQLPFRNSFQISRRSLLAADFDLSDLTLCSFLLATPGSLNCLGILFGTEVIKTGHKAFVQSERFEQALLSTVSGCTPYSVLHCRCKLSAKLLTNRTRNFSDFYITWTSNTFQSSSSFPFFLTQD